VLERGKKVKSERKSKGIIEHYKEVEKVKSSRKKKEKVR